MDNLSQHSRELSVRMLAGKIATRKTQDPFIVMGDFNMESDNPAMKYLQKPQPPYPHMLDAWASVHFREPDIGTRHGFHGGTSGPMIDHIRLCDNIIPLEARVDCRSFDGKYASDHFPVIAKLRINKSSQVTYRDTEPKTTGTAALQPKIPGGV